MNFPPQPPQSSCEISRMTSLKSWDSSAMASSSDGFKHLDPQTAQVLETSGAVIGIPVVAQFSGG